MAKILIAEDSATAAAVMQRSLAAMGHTILLACDGAEAQQKLRQEHPDLLILDVLMPKVNGFELCRSIRATPNLGDLPIIMVTSMDRASDRFWGLKQGATVYLVKPIDPAELQSTVARCLEQRAG